METEIEKLQREISTLKEKLKKKKGKQNQTSKKMAGKSQRIV